MVGRMIFAAFAKALAQMGDARFLRVLVLGLGLTIGLLIGVYLGFLWLVGLFGPGTITLPWIGPVGGIDTAIGIGGAIVMTLASIFLMVPVASAFSGIFLDSVADAVEARHYPSLPPATVQPLGYTLISGLKFFVLLVIVNICALMLFVWTGPLAPILFWGTNGYLLGREYFTLAAERRIGRTATRAMRKRYGATIWFAGSLMAAPLSIPFINLLIPVLGAATFTHLFHMLMRRDQGVSTTLPTGRVAR
jgi:CysZ protein